MKKVIQKIGIYTLRLLLALLVFSWLLVFVYRFVPVWITPLMIIRVVESFFEPEKTVGIHKSWVAYEDISPNMVLAVISAEDQKFPVHKGFDWEAIEEARKEIASGKRFRGGSTITNQTAKNVFLWPGRNLVRKGLEAYFSILIEYGWGKRRIIEVYLNVIETGDGIYGVEEAARRFFKKPAKDLSRHEAALIAAVLPNPRRWSPAQPTDYIRGRQTWIIRNMGNLGKIEWE
ncbi:Monofunctional biosynthetic peptidoglycan transglycosylase [Lunatimonas lonarensis]|uniref:Biosynthetic peptidoglycan transglycosylase n=1 Tax=Lunatimonas lonarensis TaxID=1232681 RepID=R7ZYI6_9BACT|nr:monofunctional biosynthetic peptidoglycan transglycosylase [Lunatimonas lonarensis]EON79124.1 Monofunctional biosynthetic peptidoglycan transglycosylase [Lunatimonas lonarensis]